jgi:proliferating cell nuclear antigen
MTSVQNNQEPDMEDTGAVTESQYCLELKTVQSSIFRIMIEALKEILPDTNVEFNPSGMRVISMDSSHTVLVHLRLDGSQFEYYHCPEKTIVGINMLNMFKLVKTMNNNETLTLYIEKSDTSRLGIRIENGEKNTVTNFKLDLLDLDEEEIEVPPAKFSSVINIPSNDFQKICRDMSNLSNLIEIRSVSNQLIFTCRGDFAQQVTTMGENTSNGISYVEKQNDFEIIQGVFSLKHLVLFTKCTNLCNSIQMFLENDYPLIISYHVGSLGEIKFCLAPKKTMN